MRTVSIHTLVRSVTYPEHEDNSFSVIVSIHTLVRSVTAASWEGNMTFDVSIHTLVRSVTMHIEGKVIVVNVFQSTHSCGV